MGKRSTFTVGRKKPNRELNPMEQFRRKQKEKQHLKDFVRKKSRRSQGAQPKSREPILVNSDDPLLAEFSHRRTLPTPQPPQSGVDQKVSEFLSSLSALF